MYIHRNHWTKEALVANYALRKKEIRTPRTKTNYGNKLRYHIPNILNKAEAAHEFTKTWAAFKIYVRRKSLNIDIMFY